MPSLSVIWFAATWFTLAAIAAIGVNLLLQPVRRREDGARTMLPKDVDPASLRRNRPRSTRLSGAVLIAAVLLLIGVLGPVLGIG